MSRKANELSNKKFGLLTVIGRNGTSKQGAAKWDVICECGTKKTIRGSQLTDGSTVSCGCMARKATSTRSKTHGMTNSFEFKAWTSMKKRCLYKSHPAYNLYGGRGITICSEWMSFEQFYKDMGNCPYSKGSIDRIDNTKGYEPSNCRWLSRNLQAKNRRNVKLVEGKTIPDLALELGIKYTTLKQRIKAGWTKEEYSLPVKG